MKVLIRGVVLDVGAAPPRKQGEDPFYWVKLYQPNGTERPGETADVWTPHPVDVKVGQDVCFLAAVRAEGDKLKIMRAKVVSLKEALA